MPEPSSLHLPQDYGLPNHAAELHDLVKRSDHGVDNVVIDWSGSSLLTLLRECGMDLYNITQEVGFYGLAMQQRPNPPYWPTEKFVALGSVGPSQSGNGMLFLVARNVRNLGYDAPPDEFNESVLGMVEYVESYQSRGRAEPALVSRLHANPYVHTIYETFSHKLSTLPLLSLSLSTFLPTPFS